MIRSAPRRASGRAAGFALSCALLVIPGSGGEGALAQPFRTQAAPPGVPSREVQQAFQTRIEEQANLLAHDRRVGHLSRRALQGLVESVAGNVLFASTHQLGRAILEELSLPATGGAEQAADDFAVLTLLELGKNYFSDRILMEAATGWFVRARRKETASGPSHYADTHSLRRVSRMACLMVGADAARFKTLSALTALPGHVQRNCGWDYDRAVRAWETVLRPFRPEADQPQARIDVRYEAIVGNLAIYARILRNLGFLETLAEVAASRVAWRAPFSMEMRDCGLGATWNASTRTLSVCYGIAGEVAELHRGAAHRW